MHKLKKIVLNNGLTVVFIKDKKKHTSSAYLEVKAGGLDKDFTLDDKEYHLNYGIAHFLEHYLIECSIYGNSSNMFSSDYVDSNGFTGLYRTMFYISTVHDFEDNLVKLLNIVNNPKFDKDNIEKVKIPVLREIEKKLDRPNRKANKDIFNCLFYDIPYDPTLGVKDDIKNLTIDELELFHKAFYNAKNEILVISGNIDIDNIIKIINDTYKKFNNDHISNKYIYKEKDTVVKDKCDTKGIDDSLRISYKINISKFKPKEKDKLSYYISFMLINNFSDKTDFFKHILDDKISSFSIGKHFDFGVDKNYLVFSLYLITDQYDIAEKELFNKMNNLEFDKDKFILWKNSEIVGKINLLENISNIVRDYLDNVDLYDYYNYDDIKFIKELSIDECKEYINRLDFSNYVVSRIRRDKDECNRESS